MQFFCQFLLQNTIKHHKTHTQLIYFNNECVTFTIFKFNVIYQLKKNNVILQLATLSRYKMSCRPDSVILFWVYVRNGLQIGFLELICQKRKLDFLAKLISGSTVSHIQKKFSHQRYRFQKLFLSSRTFCHCFIYKGLLIRKRLVQVLYFKAEFLIFTPNLIC